MTLDEVHEHYRVRLLALVDERQAMIYANQAARLEGKPLRFVGVDFARNERERAALVAERAEALEEAGNEKS